MVVVVVTVVVVEVMMARGMGRHGVVDGAIATTCHNMAMLDWHGVTLAEGEGSVGRAEIRLGCMGVVVVLVVMVLLVVVVVVVA